jgi:hypothetical protein
VRPDAVIEGAQLAANRLQLPGIVRLERFDPFDAQHLHPHFELRFIEARF